MVNILFKICQL